MRSKKPVYPHFGGFVRPQGAPRGLLAYYILHSLSQKPAHGYEILQDIESKTEGAWRPGAGSIYPLLKKFASRSFIRSNQAKKSLPTAQRVYAITPKGARYLKQASERFTEVGKHWGGMRRIFMEFIKPDQLSKFLVDATRAQFEMWQEMFESKTKLVSESETDYILKEYSLILKRQSDWVDNKMGTKKESILN
ncbi:MAG: PadR family transcriptional regulator [Nitrososphaerales archaeon]